MKYLYDSGKFQLIIPDIAGKTEFSVMSVRQSSVQDILRERLPDTNFDFLSQIQNSTNKKGFSTLSISGASASPHIIIRPRVETLLYASGERSNRVVYGFAPDRLNPYNVGIPGGKDNEFTATEYRPADPKLACQSIDFFSGQLAPLGWGPSLSNFGSNSDEGIELFLFGYGFGFKKKTYEVKSEIVFRVEVPSQNSVNEYRYELKGSGKDIAIGVSYQGISVGVEVARVKTLRKALQKILANIVEGFMKDLPAGTWSTEISTHDGQWIIPVGSGQGIAEGLILYSSLGSKYVVAKVDSGISFLTPDSGNLFKPYLGEALFLVPPSQNKLKVASTLEVKSLASVEIPDVTQDPQDPLPVPDTCVRKKPSTFEKFLMGITWVYGFIRYKTVFDQSFKSQAMSLGHNKIAMIGSGVDPKDNRLSNNIDSSGFDFISWDQRPSDDLGAGTAAAVLLSSKIKNARIVPLKVLTPFAGTHSSALYQALAYAAEREDIRTVVLTFKPAKNSQAIRDGVELIVKSGKTVVVPEGIHVPGAVEAPATAEYKTRGLGGAKLHLSPIGAGVIEKLIELEKNRREP